MTLIWVTFGLASTLLSLDASISVTTYYYISKVSKSSQRLSGRKETDIKSGDKHQEIVDICVLVWQLIHSLVTTLTRPIVCIWAVCLFVCFLMSNLCPNMNWGTHYMQLRKWINTQRDKQRDREVYMHLLKSTRKRYDHIYPEGGLTHLINAHQCKILCVYVIKCLPSPIVYVCYVIRITWHFVWHHSIRE